MILDASVYKTQTAPQLAADPFYQEWFFHPLGESNGFWLDLLISHSDISMQMQLAQGSLLKYSVECAFIANAIQEYSRMKTDLAGETGSEYCFNIVMDYLSRLKEQLTTFEFDRNQHEIQFFKVIKPLFTAEKEYYSLVHHVDLFAMSGGERGFWQRQPLRLEKFKMENDSFYKVYTTGETRYDEWWYCRGEFRDQTSHDGLVASYLGMVRYMNYVNQKLATI